MEKLELKHLAPYLPYGLKVAFVVREEVVKIDLITNLYDIKEYDDIKLSIGYSDGEHIWMYKPILRPLSDLTDRINPIQHHRYIEDLSFTKIEFVEKAILNGSLFMCDYNYLLENHFDVFGLIDKGLAIDINTL